MRRYVAIVVGLSGLERYLAGGKEIFDVNAADRFASEAAAAQAATQHIRTFPSCIARQMAHRVEPRT